MGAVEGQERCTNGHIMTSDSLRTRNSLNAADEYSTTT